MPLQIIRQDITKMRVDAIVSATNTQLNADGGVDLAIREKGGEELERACSELLPLGVGEAKITPAFALPSRFVIHTVGPIWKDGSEGECELLRASYINSMRLAIENGCESIAFPLISSGAYGFPKDKVLKLAMQTVADFLFDNELDVYICVYDKRSYSISKKLFLDIKSYIDDEYTIPYHFETSVSSRRLPSSMEMPALYRKLPSRSESRDVSKSEVSSSLRDYIDNMDKSFQEMLFDLIDARGMTDVECYKRANVDKRTFSKIKSNKDYYPSKCTALAFAISLRLDLEETQALLETVGYTLSKSRLFDVIIRYFIVNKKYDVIEINETLFDFDLALLGNCGSGK